MNRSARMIATVALGLAVGACSSTGSGSASPTAAPSAAATPTATSAPTPDPTVPAAGSPVASAASTDPIYDPAADPSADIAAALAAAGEDGKPVLLDFGADWCPDCVVLARMFDDAAFADYLAGVHVVRIDVGYWDRNLEVAETYGNPILTGIPSVVLVAPDGEVLGSTADGRLASASSMSPEEVLAVLRSLGH